MGTLRGFPNPPATGCGEQSSPTPTRSDPLTVPSLHLVIVRAHLAVCWALLPGLSSSEARFMNLAANFLVSGSGQV